MARVGGPASVDIFNIPNAYHGTQTGPSPGNFGVSGPNVPYIEWAPRGANTDLTSAAAFVNYGKAPSGHGHIQLKAFDFIQYTYSVPPWLDESHDMFLPDLLVYTINRLDADFDGTHVISLPALQILLRANHKDFLDASTQGSPYFSEKALRFRQLMTEYGEKKLEEFHNVLQKRGETYVRKHWGEDEFGAMKEYYDLSVEDVFWSETQFGIRDRVSFAGPVISTNMADVLRDEESHVLGDHYTHVNVGMAKRLRTVNIFGSVDKVTTGSNVWLTLRRSGANGANDPVGPFQIYPGVSSKNSNFSRYWDAGWIDYSGRICHARPWSLGVVIEPSSTSPSPSAIEGATALSPYNNRLAYAIECHEMLPTMYVAFGFKH